MGGGVKLNMITSLIIDSTINSKDVRNLILYSKKGKNIKKKERNGKKLNKKRQCYYNIAGS